MISNPRCVILSVQREKGNDMAQKIIGKYLGEAVNDAIACLDHAEKGQPFTAQYFPEGFICDLCGAVVKGN